MKKIIVFFALILAVVALLSAYPRVIQAPKGVASMFAKEYCSCRFVIGQTDEFCRRKVKQLYDVLPVKLAVDLNRKTVKASFLVYSTTSSFVSARFGCKID